MNIEDVKTLAEIVTSYGLTSLEINDGETSVKISKEAPGSQPTGQPKFTAPPDAVANIGTKTGEQSFNFNRLVDVRSPLVGVFYAAPSLDAEPFVSIGSKVKKGDVLCVIESMKLMNEIVAEQDGEIADICVQNGDIAEFGQVLFKMF